MNDRYHEGSGWVLVTLVLTIIVISFIQVYPIIVPEGKLFPIDSVPEYFWLVYGTVFFAGFILIHKAKTCLRLVLSYVLVVYAAIRMVATPYVSGLLGKDSAAFIGLTTYWFEHARISFAEVAYGDNPGFFITNKILHAIAGLDPKSLSAFTSIIWIILLAVSFRIMTFKLSQNGNYVAKKESNKYMSNTISLLAPLTYFALSVPFVVNFQFTPQTATLVTLLAIYSFMYNASLRLKNVIVMLIVYYYILITHPFMHTFLLIYMVSVLAVLRLFATRERNHSNYAKTYVQNITTLILIFLVSSFAYILYITLSIKMKLIDALLTVFGYGRLESIFDYYRRFTVMGQFSYSQMYIIISIAFYLLTILAALIFALATLSGLWKKLNVQLVAFLISSFIWIAFSSIVLGSLSARGSQILLFGLIIGASYSLFLRGKKNVHVLKILVILVILLTVLGNVKYLWYTHSPYLSDNDVVAAEMFHGIIGANIGGKILTHTALAEYYDTRYNGHVTANFINTYRTLTNRIDINSLLVFRTNRLRIDLLKYGLLLPSIEDMAKARDIIMSSDLGILYNHRT